MSRLPNKKLRRCLEKIQNIATIYVLIPGYFVFQMIVMRPNIIQILNMNPFVHYFHTGLSTYCFTNVTGNMMLSMMIDPTLRKYKGEGTYCDICKQNRPSRSWHCKTCNACIVRRDHHCVFLAQCIGRYNQRYFICFLIHVTTSLAYAGYYNFFVVAWQYEPIEFAIASAKILNPLLSYFWSEPIGVRELFILFWYMNLIVFLINSVLLYKHLKNVINGVTWYESKKKVVADTDWLSNVRSVLGTRWYLAILWPFVDSSLPVQGQ